MHDALNALYRRADGGRADGWNPRCIELSHRRVACCIGLLRR